MILRNRYNYSHSFPLLLILRIRSKFLKLRASLAFVDSVASLSSLADLELVSLGIPLQLLMEMSLLIG